MNIKFYKFHTQNYQKEVSYWSVVYLPRKQILRRGWEFIMKISMLTKNVLTEALYAMTWCYIIFNLYLSDCVCLNNT